LKGIRMEKHSESVPTKDADSLQELWTWAHHEDTLFDSRFEKFATVHAILIGAAALVLQRTHAAVVFVVGVAVLGFLLSALWWYVLRRSQRLLSSLEGELLQRDPMYGRHIRRGRISQTKLMLTVPVLIAAFWIFLCVGVFRGWLGGP
jgi:hypothetical protein